MKNIYVKRMKITLDSYSELNIDFQELPSSLKFILDKLSLKFNLATCYSRITARIDLNEQTGQGVI